MKFEKGNTMGVRFKKGQSGNPKGKPKALARVIGEIPPDAQEEIYRTLHSALAMESIDEAVRYIKEEGEKHGKYGAVFQVAVRALNGNNGWQALCDILDRLFGKPKQTADLNVTKPSAQLGITIE
jgi:hypothetical protein